MPPVSSDLVLIPSKAVVGELETLGQVHDLLRVAGNPSVFVLSEPD